MFRTLAFRFAGTYALIFTLFVSMILGVVYIVATQEIRGISEREIQYDMQALRSAYDPAAYRSYRWPSVSTPKARPATISIFWPKTGG